MTSARERNIIEARAELKLLLRYCDEGITIRRHNIERVLASLEQTNTMPLYKSVDDAVPVLIAAE